MIRLLHLADIHLCDSSKEWAETYRSQLEHDMIAELNVTTLDYLVVAGDIAGTAAMEEYESANRLLSGVMHKFNVPPENVIIVPGNHDLNWDISRKEGYELRYKQDVEPKELAYGRFIPMGEDVVSLRVPAAYRRRFRHFSDFYQHITNTQYPLEEARQGLVYPFKQHELLFLGLNSAFEIDHYFKTRSGISPGALNLGLDAMAGYDCSGWLKIAVCHHPVTGPEMMQNTGFMERLSQCGFQVLLHGHIHEAQQNFYHFDSKRQIHIVGCGTFGAPAREMVSGIPHQYNLLEFDSENNRITVRTRRKEKPEGAWGADPRWGDRNSPVPHYEISLREKDGDMSKNKTETCLLPPETETDAPLEIPDAYRDWVFERCGHMDVDRLRETGTAITVRLPEVFIPLFTTPEKERKGRAASGHDPEMVLRTAEHARDVEDVIAEGHDLVIGGEAGCGKTTLVKHFVYMCLKEADWKGLTGILPVLVFLKDLKGWERPDAPANADTAEALLRHGLEKNGCCLDIATIRRYCAAGRALFIFDGLDEIEIELRNLVVNAFASYRLKCNGGRFVFSGRPHGVEGDIVERFGRHRITILPLTMDQVETFIGKWFEHVALSETNRITKTAQGMISEVRENPGVERLIYNPLMLTAVCILYHDQNELPGQRAELYKKFTDNMLHRGKRFDNPDLIHAFLMALAYRNHTKGQKGCDIQSAREVLKTIYPICGRTEIEYKLFIHHLFEQIEPNCGLLKWDAGQLMFRHLTFQEFLTAEYIKDNETRYDAAIETYWDDEWYKEVVELLVGLLSIDAGKWANEVVTGALEKTDNPPFMRWRLAARAILDIHADRRSTHVIDLATEKMRDIIVSAAAPKDRADAGETLGWLGDRRDLEQFIQIPDGSYKTSLGKVRLQGFEMAKYPVTNQWYAKFVAAGGYENETFWTEEGLKWLAHTKATSPWLWHDRGWNCPNRPVVGICWWEADAFCKWLSARDDGYVYRLPSEKEWEATAAGRKKREFPWGRGFDTNKCNARETQLGKTSAVGMFQDGDTPEGVAEFAGNVWEWTGSDYYRKKELGDFLFETDAQALYERIISTSGDEQQRFIDEYNELFDDKNRQFPALRGGSWLGGGDGACCAARDLNHPDDRIYSVGFRCSRTKR